jgi:capsular exopolysaccharide synthesis family protein
MLDIIRRHRWTVITTVICLVGITLLITSQLPRRYTATALLVVDSRDAQILGFQPSLAEGFGPNAAIDTQVEIARASKVLVRAAVDLDLVNSADFAPRPSILQRLAIRMGLEERPPENLSRRSFEDLSDAEQASLIEAFSKTIQISRRGLTSVIALAATASSPQAAARIANAIADAYLKDQIDAKLSSTARAAAVGRETVAKAADNRRIAEARVDGFIATQLPNASGIVAQLHEQSERASRAATTLEQIRAATNDHNYDQLARFLGSQESDLNRQRAAISQEITSTEADDTRRAELQRQLDELESRILAASQSQVSSLQAEVLQGRTSATNLRQQLDRVLSQGSLSKEAALEFDQLQTDAEIQRRLYEEARSKLAQIEQQTAFNIPDSRVIGYAAPPSHPSYPPMKLIAAFALIFSLGLGIGLAFLREHFFGGITSLEQLENSIGLPVVAGVPRYRAKAAEDAVDAVVSQPLSSFSESIRRIRMGIAAYAPHQKICVFVTSAVPAEGKTTVALALARQLSLGGSSVVLIDADMRRPMIHEYIHQKPARGLIGYLSGTDSEQLAITRETSTGLDIVMGASASLVATDALLLSGRFAELVKYAKEKYDVVVIDTPPIGLVVDAKIVAKYADVGVLVVRYAATSHHDLRGALRDLRLHMDIPILGVLNQTQHGGAYSYGYGRRYRDYYHPNVSQPN